MRTNSQAVSPSFPLSTFDPSPGAKATGHPPAINASKPRFSNLLTAFEAAVAFVGEWCGVEDELSSAHPTDRPNIFGGTTSPQTIVRDGKPDIDIPPSDWFYRSRDDIEREAKRGFAKAGNDEEARAAVHTRATELLAEFDRQEKEIASAVPKALRIAQRKLNEAHRAWNKAEQAIVSFKPANLADAIALLEFVGKPGTRGVFFQVNDEDLKTIMRNAAATMRLAS
jgi:hypothetical protein